VSAGRPHRPLVVGHRGSAGAAPENTMSAFRMAADAGADMIEFDVRMTRDGELVVHHDRRLGRTSDGKGRVRALDAADLRAADAGFWFGRRFRGERIPLLTDVLSAVPRSVGLDIEVKTDGDRARLGAIARALARALRRARRHEGVVVTSFDHGFLRRLHRLDPSLRLGVLYVPVRDRFRSAGAIARRSGAAMFICSRRQLRRRHLREAHSAGVTVAVYGVNTAEDAAAAARAGVDAVITDHPGRILRALSTS